MFRQMACAQSAAQASGVQRTDRLADRLNGCGLPIFEVESPDGLDFDAGVASQHTVRATQTAKLVAEHPICQVHPALLVRP
jgi:hypothetical protein